LANHDHQSSISERTSERTNEERTAATSGRIYTYRDIFVYWYVFLRLWLCVCVCVYAWRYKYQRKNSIQFIRLLLHHRKFIKRESKR